VSKDRPRNMAASVRARPTDLARTTHAAEFVLKGAMLFRLWADQLHLRPATSTGWRWCSGSGSRRGAVVEGAAGVTAGLSV